MNKPTNKETNCPGFSVNLRTKMTDSVYASAMLGIGYVR